MRKFIRILRNVRGATAIEYGLIVALICIAILGGMQMFANETIGMWEFVVDTLSAAIVGS